jgi:osmotically-inducible protein OsmY
MTNAEGSALATRIERELALRAGINAVVDVRSEEIVLSGRVDTGEALQAAEDIVTELAPQLRLTNDLEVEVFLPVDVTSFDDSPAAALETVQSLEELAAIEQEVDPDFTDQPLDTSGLTMSGVDPDEDDAGAYFPPTDPVITTDKHGDAEVLGGFSATSYQDVEVDRSALDGEYGDETIADAVRRELREDAATTDLRIEVVVRHGVVHLQGIVPDVDDAENAEEVAARVPGVQDVVEELTVRAV